MAVMTPARLLADDLRVVWRIFRMIRRCRRHGETVTMEVWFRRWQQ